MKYTPEQKKALFDTVESLMRKAGILIRDTWNGYDGENLDDGFENNGQSGGVKLVDIIKIKDGKAAAHGVPYMVDGYNSVAYDSFKIYIPERLAYKMHPVIHESVHFLQHNTLELDKNYVEQKSEDIEDYRAYIEQRAELEAHFVQLLYIDEHELALTNKEIKREFKKRLQEALIDSTKRVEFILYAKCIGVI